jgi:hypothetical protein
MAGLGGSISLQTPQRQGKSGCAKPGPGLGRRVQALNGEVFRAGLTGSRMQVAAGGGHRPMPQHGLYQVNRRATIERIAKRERAGASACSRWRQSRALAGGLYRTAHYFT